MLTLTKILSLFVYPLSLGLFFVGLSLWGQLRGNRAAAGLCTFLAVAVLYFPSTQMGVEMIAAPLEARYPAFSPEELPNGDVIIVLGGGIGWVKARRGLPVKRHPGAGLAKPGMAQIGALRRREGLGNGEKPAILQHGQAFQPAIGWRIPQPRRCRDIKARSIQLAVSADAVAAFKSDQPGAIGPPRQRLSIRGETARQGPPGLIAQRPVAQRVQAHGRQPIQQQPRCCPMAAITDQGEGQVGRQMRPGKSTAAQCLWRDDKPAQGAEQAGNIGQRKRLRRILCPGRLRAGGK